MTHYKIHLDPTCNSLAEVTFEELCKAKGIKTLRKQSDTFSYRARTDRPKVFKGWDSSLKPKHGITLKSLEAYVEENNIQAYVKAWRSINHLTQ